MRAWWRRRRLRRYRIRAWKNYYRAYLREEYRDSQGLGHPEWLTPPPFPDPRIPQEENA